MPQPVVSDSGDGRAEGHPPIIYVEAIMSFLANAALQKKFVKALNANERFAEQALWFDGSVLLECNSDRLWLKIYKGQVIDLQTAVPPFGYTFKFSGPEAAWKALTSGKRLWADLTFPGTRNFENDPKLETAGAFHVDIATEGNMLEASRLTEAMFELAYTLRDVCAK
ncbi:MAG: hypothetical protein HY943_07370 [Gammaproteobacteria bacterium]|nr:hypothetical protein [Gammaproteobacteria bacterium]